MTYYHLPTNTARNPGRVEAKLLDGRPLRPPEGRWTDALAAACGFVRVVDTARPDDTDTDTHTRSVELVKGTPTVVWTERPWTADELAAREAAANYVPPEDRLDALERVLVDKAVATEAEITAARAERTARR